MPDTEIKAVGQESCVLVRNQLISILLVLSISYFVYSCIVYLQVFAMSLFLISVLLSVGHSVLDAGSLEILESELKHPDSTTLQTKPGAISRNRRLILGLILFQEPLITLLHRVVIRPLTLSTILVFNCTENELFF